MIRFCIAPCVLLMPLVILLAPLHSHAEPKRHAIALGAEPKYPPDFTHFDYTKPDAPQGGSFSTWTQGAFDTFNPFLPKGFAAAGVGNIYESLAISSQDEPFTKYGLVAEYMELAEDNTWITFYMRPEARFHDGAPITAHDVGFSYDILLEKGRPVYKQYYADVEGYEIIDDHTIKFTFSTGNNRELPLIISELSILPRHFWEGKDFAQANLDLPLGSGAYRIKEFDVGRHITYERVEDYWAKDLPVSQGRQHFDTIRYEYYRDSQVAFEAFKAGEYSFRQENISRQWATGYEGPAFDAGHIIKEEIRKGVTWGIQAFVFNSRREIFKDPKVRKALAYAFDFEWANANLFHGAYVRTDSYFANGELESSGLPSPEELELLEPLRGQIPEQVFTQTYAPPSTAAPSSLRQNLKQGLMLLQEAGWTLQDGVMTKNGTPLEFQILMHSPSFERVFLPMIKNLERMGVKAEIRRVDTTQWLRHVREFDFDMTTVVLPQTESPGNEQRSFFSSAAADTPDSMNLMGIKDPAVDSLVESIINAKDRKALVAAVHALDRVLLWNHYVIPGWHSEVWNVAYWNKFSQPAIQPKYALGTGNWWADPGKRDALLKAMPELAGKGM